MSTLPHIAVLGTGGTIAGQGSAGKASDYVAGRVSTQDLISAAPGCELLAHISAYQICNVDSDDITARHWLELAHTINHLASHDEADGFVITHGTDTLEETAYFLHLVLNTSKPVVITGAMRPASAISADGPMNLYQAIALAANPIAAGLGVLTVFSNGIYGARDVQKTSTFRPQAFDCRDQGALGYMNDEFATIYSTSTRKHTLETPFREQSITRLPRVDIAFFSATANIDLLRFMAQKIDGIVIAGVGSGCYSSEWIEAVAQIASQGIPVVRTSRISNGIVADYTHLKSSGVIIGDNLTPQKARILLSLALTITSDPQEIQSMFRQF